MKKGLFLLLLLTILILPSVISANCGGAVQCACGDTLNESQTMWYDLNICPGKGITIHRSNVFLDCSGHNIQGDYYGQNVGIHVKNSQSIQSNVEIKNCNISGFSNGMIFEENIKRIKIFNNSIQGDTIWNEPLTLTDAEYFNISHNKLSFSEDRVFGALFSCGRCKYFDISSNIFGGNNRTWSVLSFAQSEYGLINNNKLVVEDIGFDLVNSNNLIISNNDWNNSNTGQHRLELRFSDYNQIINNSLRKSTEGIIMYDSNHNLISDNEFKYNDNGIRFNDGDSKGNNITGNIFLDNLVGIDLLSSQNNLVWSNKFIGNNQNAIETNIFRTNYWNFSNIGNYWDDFESNPGFPNYYEIPGTGTEKDYSPVWNFSSAPNTPEQPIGPTNGINLENYNFTTNTTDPEGDSIYYQWDWGNGNYSDWQGPFNSGVNINSGYSWENPGIYNISVRAKDINQIESNWSDYLTINISQTDNYYFDNSDSNFFKIFGRWKNYDYVNSYNGNLRYIQNGIGVGSVGWRVSNTVPQGSYDVYVWKFEHPFQSQTATNAKYSVTDVNGTVGWFEVNQSSPGNEWILMGNYYFDNSSPQGVTLNDDADGIVIADAIKLVAV